MLQLFVFACALALCAGCGNPAIEPSVPFPAGGVEAEIVGGETAVAHSWPWMAEVIKDDFHYCGGTLIDPWWIVTAAHCFTSEIPALNRYVFSLGGHIENTLAEATRQTRTASKIIKNENYNPIMMNDDIALVKLSSPVIYDDYVSPACVASNAPSAGTMAMATGWGDQETAIHDLHLQQVDLPIETYATCAAIYGSGALDDSMICAGWTSGGKDTCQGDSGGPLVVRDLSGLWTLVGITSWGSGCADIGRLGVYANVAHLKSWIDYTMSAN